MKSTPLLLSFLIGAALPIAAQNAALVNYWDFESPDPFLDKKGAADSSVTATTTITTVTGVRGLQAMNAQTSVGGDDDLVNIDGTTLHQPGESAFSMSYWFRIPDDGLTVARGIFDFSANGKDGVQSLFIDNSTNPNGQPSMAFRIDHDNGAVTLDFVPLTEGPDWHFVAATYDPATGLEVHFDGFGVDASVPPHAIPDPVSMDPDSYFGSFNFTGAAGDKGLSGDLDDFAIYRGVLTQSEIEGLFAGTLTPPDIDAPPPPSAPIGHYWNFDTRTAFIPDDLYGGLVTTESGIPSVVTHIDWGQAYPGSGVSLNSDADFGDHLVAETHSAGAATALDFGTGNFAFSFWSYNDTSDGDPRGAEVFDCLFDQESGLQLGATDTGVFNLQIDDDAGNSVVSNTTAGFENVMQPDDQWVHVVLNIDRLNNQLAIHFNGSLIAEGAIDLSALTGGIACSQDLEIGTREFITQDSGLDDFAIYPDILSPQQITDLATAATTPLEVLASFEAAPEIPVISVTRNAGTGELTVTFTSTHGSVYSIYGGEDFAASASWSELTTGDLVGDGTDLNYSFTPAGTPDLFFFQVRED